MPEQGWCQCQCQAFKSLNGGLNNPLLFIKLAFLRYLIIIPKGLIHCDSMEELRGKATEPGLATGVKGTRSQIPGRLAPSLPGGVIGCKVLPRPSGRGCIVSAGAGVAGTCDSLGEDASSPAGIEILQAGLGRREIPTFWDLDLRVEVWAGDLEVGG